VGER
jgi:hypothetical protein